MRKLAALVVAGIGPLLASCGTPPPPNYTRTYSTPTASQAPSPSKPPGIPTELTTQQQRVVRAGTASRLKDPESARFGRMSGARDPDGDLTVCGFVNGKNSYGGYTGMQPFIGMLFNAGTPQASFHLVDIGSTDTKRSATFEVCRNRGINLGM